MFKETRLTFLACHGKNFVGHPEIIYDRICKQAVGDATADIFGARERAKLEY